MPEHCTWKQRVKFHCSHWLLTLAKWSVHRNWPLSSSSVFVSSRNPKLCFQTVCLRLWTRTQSHIATMKLTRHTLLTPFTKQWRLHVQHHPSFRTTKWRTEDQKVNREAAGDACNWDNSFFNIHSSLFSTPELYNSGWLTAVRARTHDKLRCPSTCGQGWLAGLMWLNGCGMLL